MLHMKWNEIFVESMTDRLYSVRATPLLGGASHFASFHEALAEQSARISLECEHSDSITLDYDP